MRPGWGDRHGASRERCWAATPHSLPPPIPPHHPTRPDSTNDSGMGHSSSTSMIITTAASLFVGISHGSFPNSFSFPPNVLGRCLAGRLAGKVGIAGRNTFSEYLVTSQIAFQGEPAFVLDWLLWNCGAMVHESRDEYFRSDFRWRNSTDRDKCRRAAGP